MGVHVGCVVTYEDPFMILNDKFYVGRALDNRVGGFMIAQVTAAALVAENEAVGLDTGYRLFSSYAWAGPMCWFRYDDKGTDPSDQSNFFGLLRFDGSRKPSYSTFVADAAAAIP